MRELVRAEGLEDAVAVESAGTGAWHVGEPPDARAVATAAAARRGGRGRGPPGRGSRTSAAPTSCWRWTAPNRDALLALAPGPSGAGEGPPAARRSTQARAARASSTSPTPTTAAPGGFERVLDVVTAACRGLLAELRADGRA